MDVLFWVIILCLQCVTWLLIALPLQRYAVSDFSAKHLASGAGGALGTKLRWLFRVRDHLAVLRFASVFFCILLTISLLNYRYTPWLSAAATVALLLGAVLFAKLSFMQNFSEKILLAHLSYVQSLTRFLNPFLRPFVGFFQTTPRQVASYEELQDDIRRLPSTILNPTQKQHIEAVLTAETKTAKEIMTPKRRIVMVEPSATLGPVLLSDLQKSGHGFFPVASKKGTPEGILHLRDVSNIHDAKQRLHVRDLMKDYLAWVTDDMNLIQLTCHFLKEKQYILFVKTTEGEFAGIVTVADLIKHLVGITEASGE